jgi:pimeloyl-ACP methyl ester carboxylesterase
VCSYDRAGLGWSEPSAEPRDARHAIQDLHALLANSGEQGPFVLVGHSNGGLRVTLYASAYPREVAGVVLVDPTPRATDAEMITFLAPAERAEYLALIHGMKSDPEHGGFNVFALMQTLRPFGITRLLTDTLLQGSPYPYVSAEARPAFRFGMNQRARLATTIAETEQRQTSIDQVRAAGSLGSLPVAVLTSTKLTAFYRDPQPIEPSGRLLALVQKSLWEAEVDMSRLSSNRTIMPVERSGHYIQFDRPDSVIHVVQQMVDSLTGR